MSLRSLSTPDSILTEVAPDVFCISGTEVNVALLREGSSLTLIDGGWPGDVTTIERAIRSLGHQSEDIKAILLTHAHIDHLGAVQSFHDRFNIPIYADSIEVHHAAREYLEQATEADVTKGPVPQTAQWLQKVQKVGMSTDITITDVLSVPEGPMDVPGRPIAIATHGHTSGHSAFYLSSSRVIITGDSLITAHACSTVSGPQPCPWFFNHSIQDALTALQVLKTVDANIIVPGHGPPIEMPLAEAVGIALKNAEITGFDQH